MHRQAHKLNFLQTYAPASSKRWLGGEPGAVACSARRTTPMALRPRASTRPASDDHRAPGRILIPTRGPPTWHPVASAADVGCSPRRAAPMESFGVGPGAVLRRWPDALGRSRHRTPLSRRTQPHSLTKCPHGARVGAGEPPNGSRFCCGRLAGRRDAAVFVSRTSPSAQPQVPSRRARPPAANACYTALAQAHPRHTGGGAADSTRARRTKAERNSRWPAPDATLVTRSS